jgi:hypothetical protein
VAPPIDISYAAHTSSCTFLLDDEGICRRVVMASKGKRRESSRTAARCVGAQYVASLDSGAAGGLVEMPRVGATLLFARVDERGRVSLVRTGVLTSFESRAGEDPFATRASVETSAPVLEALAIQGLGRDPDYLEPSDRTQRIAAVRSTQCRADTGASLEIETQGDLLPPEDDTFDRNHVPSIESEVAPEAATAEYRSYVPAPPAPRRTRSSATEVGPSGATTLRRAPSEAVVEGNDKYPRSSPPSRSSLPKRTEPKSHPASAARAWTPDAPPPAYGSDVQVTRRRRGG